MCPMCHRRGRRSMAIRAITNGFRPIYPRFLVAIFGCCLSDAEALAPAHWARRDPSESPIHPIFRSVGRYFLLELGPRGLDSTIDSIWDDFINTTPAGKRKLGKGGGAGHVCALVVSSVETVAGFNPVSSTRAGGSGPGTPTAFSNLLIFPSASIRILIAIRGFSLSSLSAFRAILSSFSILSALAISWASGVLLMMRAIRRAVALV
jgi:hypothetical protein